MKRLPLEPEFLTPLPAEIDLRLVVTDMDGTLIDGEGRVPVGLNQVVAQMREASVQFWVIPLMTRRSSRRAGPSPSTGTRRFTPIPSAPRTPLPPSSQLGSW